MPSVNAIDNTNLLQMCFDCGAVGFLPAFAYAYDAEAATITVTNTSTIPAGDTFAVAKLRVMDQFGGEIRGNITVAATPNVIDVSGLDRSKGLNLMVHMHTVGHIAADGIAVNVGAAGNVGGWDVQKNA